MFLTSEKNQIDMGSWFEEYGELGRGMGGVGSKNGGVDLMDRGKDKVEKV